MFLDEAPKDGMYTANEPMLAHAGVPVALQGPGVTDVALGATDETGAFTFGELRAGSYRVLVNMTEEVAAAIAMAGFAFAGDLTGEVVTVAAGQASHVAFPFNIVVQTINVGAAMGNDEETGAAVAGVEVTLYANADKTGMLGMSTTNDMGHATFDFARADDTGPGGNDHLVFVAVSGTGHEDLAVSDNNIIEVAYPAIARSHNAPAAVKLLNTRANFQYWVKSDMDARGGDMLLAGWKTDVYMGDPEAEGAMPLEDASMPTEGMDGELGRASVSYAVAAADLPATFTVMVAAGQSSEMYDQSDALTHTHTGIEHPDANTAAMNDKGPIYVTWTTQTLTVGVYREVDDEPGFTDFRAPQGGDAHPHANVAAEMTVELMTRDSRDRLRRYEYDHDGKESTDPIGTMGISGGMASFPHLPAGMEFTARFHVGSDRTLVGPTDDGDVDAFGDDLGIGMSSGAFGDASGAGPEVMLCSVSTDEDSCATWAYQWTTGSVSGHVAGAGGASVSLDAETNNHDRSATTSKAAATLGNYAISDIQDGEYKLTTPTTADNAYSPKGGYTLEIYHDEGEDDENDDTDYVGTASTNMASFTATKLRLSIKGFVANDGGDGRARGNEAMAGVTVNLMARANARDTEYSVVAKTAETDGNGMYEFNELVQGSRYRVAVVAGDDYVGLRGLGVSKSGVVSPATYPAISEPFPLPSWNHASNTASNTTASVGRAPGPVATVQNFALVYTTSSVSGSVTNLSGSNAGILVEAAMCETYTADDPATGDVNDPMDEEHCEWGTVMRTESAGRGGNYEFPGLMEGYYAVWFTGGGLAAANTNAMGRADDDGGTPGAGMHIGAVMGRNQYLTGRNFTVYTTRPGMDSDNLLTLMVRGATTQGDTTTMDFAAGVDITAQNDNDEGSTAVSLTGTPTVSFESGGVSIKTTQSAGAGARAALTTAVRGSSAGNLPFNKTGATDAGDPIETGITVTVTAANGYNDHDYTFDVTRAAPVNNAATISVGGDEVDFANGVGTSTIAAADTEAEISVNLTEGQTVTASSGSDGLTGVPGEADETIITFTVATPVGQTTVTVTVKSEDGVDNVRTVNVVRPTS